MSNNIIKIIINNFPRLKFTNFQDYDQAVLPTKYFIIMFRFRIFQAFKVLWGMGLILSK